MDDTGYGSANFESTGVNVVRYGTVVDRRLTNAGAQVRVQYVDRGVTSDWLPVGQSGSRGTVFYNPPPQIDDNVTVLHFPTGIERGVVVCSNNTLNNLSFKPRSINSIGVQGKDGSYFEYNPDKQCLSINGIATLYFNASGQMKIVCGGDLDATVSQNLNATVSGDLSANVSGSATITAPNIKLAGNVEITGTCQIDNNLTVNGSQTTVQNLQINGVEAGGGGT